MGDGGGGGSGGGSSSFAWDDKGYTHRGAGPGLSKKNPLYNNPPVRSSQFPGPGVYVCRAITHQLP